MIYTLIIWSALCTSLDTDCDTGDWYIHTTFENSGDMDAHTACETDLLSWLKVSGNRGYCYAGSPPESLY